VTVKRPTEVVIELDIPPEKVHKTMGPIF